MKYLLILLLVSCGTMRRSVVHKKVTKFHTKQQKIIKCFEFVKAKGSSDRFAGMFCRDIFKEL